MRFQAWKRVAAASLVLAFGLGVAAQQAAKPEGPEGPNSPPNSALNPSLAVVHVDHGPNSAEAQGRHYVVLVSLDGFRWDYAERDGATHLLALGKQGVWAPEGMLPSYPSLTFPNHFTIVTGLYPEHHGLVANSFYDPARQARYAYNDPQAVTDGSWYSGTPLWSLAESQGMRTACLFWPGSEAKIAGLPAHVLLAFRQQIEDTARIRQVLAWLRLPTAERPHLIALYYPEPDHAGHQFGPDAGRRPKPRCSRWTALIGKLKAGLDATGLPIDLVVVSDHGMAKTEGGWITLDQFADLAGFETAGALLYGKTEEDRARVYNQLKKASSQFVVYRRKDVPAEPQLQSESPRRRSGGHCHRSLRYPCPRSRSRGSGSARPIGMHGFDPRKLPQMKAIFFAAGPDIVVGKTVAPFENVNFIPGWPTCLDSPPQNRWQPECAGR